MSHRRPAVRDRCYSQKLQCHVAIQALVVGAIDHTHPPATVRSYLKLRVPAFYLSPSEVRKLIRFFQAFSEQPMLHRPQKFKQLTGRGTAMARALSAGRGAPCLKRRAAGLPSHDKNASAPDKETGPGARGRSRACSRKRTHRIGN